MSESEDLELPRVFQCDFCDDTCAGAQMYLSNGGCPVCDVPVNYKISLEENHASS